MKLERAIQIVMLITGLEVSHPNVINLIYYFQVRIFLTKIKLPVFLLNPAFAGFFLMASTNLGINKSEIYPA